MSTYSGDAQIVELKTVSGSVSTGTTLYTVPAGRHAEVQILKASNDDANNRITVAGADIMSSATGTDTINGGMVIDTSTNILRTALPKYLLLSGDTITGDDTTYIIKIKEFNNP